MAAETVASWTTKHNQPSAIADKIQYRVQHQDRVVGGGGRCQGRNQRTSPVSPDRYFVQIMLAKSLNKYVETNLKEQSSAILFTCDVLLLHRLYLAMMFSHHLTAVQRYFFLRIEIRI